MLSKKTCTPLLLFQICPPIKSLITMSSMGNPDLHLKCLNNLCHEMVSLNIYKNYC